MNIQITTTENAKPNCKAHIILNWTWTADQDIIYTMPEKFS